MTYGQPTPDIPQTPPPGQLQIALTRLAVEGQTADPGACVARFSSAF